MYQLYQATRSAAMSTHAALEEVGAEYRLHDVDLSKPRAPEFLFLNPQGKVPVLIHETAGERRVLYQSAACLLYIADRHPEARLAPAVGTASRGHLYQWLFYMAESLQQPFLAYFYAERYTTDPAGVDALKAKAVENIAAAWAHLDRALAQSPFLLGAQAGIADLYMLTFAIWHKPEMRPLAAHANLARTLESVRARPAVRTMLGANGVV